MFDTPPHTSVSVTLLLGGVRAGKSARALQLAQRHTPNETTGNVLFVATAQAFDTEMEKRISAHKSERPAAWSTIEEPLRLTQALDEWFAQHHDTRVVVIDCITLWVSNVLLAHPDRDDIEQMIAQETRQLIQTMRRHASYETAAGAVPREWVIVSNEVGLGVVPPTPLGRQYRDALGRANQLLAESASDVTLLVAGIAMPLKSRTPV